MQHFRNYKSFFSIINLKKNYLSRLHLQKNLRARLDNQCRCQVEEEGSNRELKEIKSINKFKEIFLKLILPKKLKVLNRLKSKSKNSSLK